MSSLEIILVWPPNFMFSLLNAIHPIPVYAMPYPIIVLTSRIPLSFKYGIALINFITEATIMLTHSWCFSFLSAKLPLFPSIDSVVDVEVPLCIGGEI